MSISSRRDKMVKALVQDVFVDASDNGVEVFRWFVENYYANLALAELEGAYTDAGLGDEDEQAD